MSKQIITLGLASVKMGDIAGDGGMGATLTALGLTNEGSCNFIAEDAQTTDFRAEENDQPVASIETPGKTVLSFQLMDPNADNLIRVLGGAKATVDGRDQWNAPLQTPNIERSVEVTPKKGMTLKIPRAKIAAKWNAQLTRNGVFVLDVTCTVLTPSKEGEAPYMLHEPAVA